MFKRRRSRILITIAVVVLLILSGLVIWFLIPLINDVAVDWFD